MLHLAFDITANSYHSDRNDKVMLALVLWNGEEPSMSLVKKSWIPLPSGQIYFHGGGRGEKKFYLVMHERKKASVSQGRCSCSSACWCSRHCDYVSPENWGLRSSFCVHVAGQCRTPGSQTWQNAGGCSASATGVSAQSVPAGRQACC